MYFKKCDHEAENNQEAGGRDDGNARVWRGRQGIEGLAWRGVRELLNLDNRVPQLGGGLEGLRRAK